MIGFLKSLSGHILGFIFVFGMSFLFSNMATPIVSAILTVVFLSFIGFIHRGHNIKLVIATLNVFSASMFGCYLGAIQTFFFDANSDQVAILMIGYGCLIVFFHYLAKRSNGPRFDLT